MKQIAKILVPLTGFGRDAASLGTAFGLAEFFGAHIESLFACPDPHSFPLVGVPFSLGVVDAMMDGQAIYAVEAEKSAREILARVSAGRSAQPEGGVPATYAFRSEVGPPPAIISRRARLTDLVVFPSIRLPGFIEIIEAFLSVLTKLERPVVVSSDTASNKPISSVAIGWNGSKSSARAVMAAVPLLKRAKKVFVLEVAEAHKRPPADSIDRYLALHGIKTMRKSARLGPPSVGDMLAQGASDLGVDLLVMGGYGHSHFREAFLGGVTADVLARVSMPVFLAH